MVRVKICGNTCVEQVQLCAESGADCVGLVVEYPVPVPWNLSCDAACALIRQIPPMVTRVVVTGGPPEKVLSLSRRLMPHLVQLHTDNTLAETATMARALAPLGIGLIRALRIDVATQKACGEISDPVRAALGIQATGVAAVLVDASTANMPAGTGVRVDWTMARTIREALSVPLVLAGGLTPQNVRSAVEQVRPYAVDVITGVEASRTVKSPELVQAFVRQAKSFD